MPSCLNGNPCWFFRSKMMKTCPDPVAEHSYFDSPGVNLNPCWTEWNPFPSATSAGLKPSSSLMKTLSQQSLQKNASKTKRISTIPHLHAYTRENTRRRNLKTMRGPRAPTPASPKQATPWCELPSWRGPELPKTNDIAYPLPWVPLFASSMRFSWC